MKIKPVFLFLPNWVYIAAIIHLSRASDSKSHLRNVANSLTYENSSNAKLPVLFDSSGLDGELQNDLVKAVFLALGVAGTDGFKPVFIDISEENSVKRTAQALLKNDIKVIVSLMESEVLLKFTYTYDQLSNGMQLNETKKMHIYTPRTFIPSFKFPDCVAVKSLQMSEEARAIALLNKVRKVGVKSLIPILDDSTLPQVDLLKLYHRLLKEDSKTKGIRLSRPILLNDPAHTNKLKMILQEHSGFHENYLKEHDGEIGSAKEQKLNKTESLKPGILLLAQKGSKVAMKIAAQKHHLLLSWFSPNMLEIEEWVLSMHNEDKKNLKRTREFEAVPRDNAGQVNSAETASNNSLFGLYTVNFVGSNGWDNPMRRRVLRELTTFTGASPRILYTVLAYDAATLARGHLKNELDLHKFGLSGQIDFNNNGFRRNGTFLGASSVPKMGSSDVTLLQPSTWILEDIIHVNDTENGKTPEITDYDVATSSILTKEELIHVANSTRNKIGCNEHLMNIVTYDPFNQMPYHYFFTENNLPETIMVPNQHGFGITFVCSNTNIHSTTGEGDSMASTLELACTPGYRMSHPINCYRSNVNRRQKRAITKTDDKIPKVPSVQYQYSFSENDPWHTHNSNWAASKGDVQSQYYYQPNREYQVESVTYGYPTTRLDHPSAASEDLPTPAPGAPKLPELRQILKAAKPFVGSCIGSSTGCAMCVLVLGRLPLGNNPTACTGPCFVGTFGSCGSLLGRVFSETTVICTELFRQGLLDIDTFMADSEFGYHLSTSSPYTMKGYTLLATPLVDLMKSSKFITEVVATFALPWAQHMKYLLGRSDETSVLGSIVHFVGYPICNVVGRLSLLFTSISNILSCSIIVVSPFLTCLVTILFILTQTNLGFTKDYKHASIFQCFITSVLLINCFGKIGYKITSYFKAIGRST